MPTNEQRRETAKRKLERQLERRAAQERRRRLVTIVGSVVGVLLVIGAVVATVIFTSKDSDTQASADTPSSTSAGEPAPSPGGGTLPPFVAPANLGADCQYPATPGEPASKKNNPPRSGKVPTDPAQISASMTTSEGNLGLQLDNAKAPCTVNSFASLAQQGYFNDTPCHRLTTSPGLSVLQCGDPTGNGTGGPGYGFVNEYPSDQYRPDDPALQAPVVYPRGTLAMANTGAPGSNGSQFFLVYKDSQLPPNYTAFGTIDATGLATLDKIAKAGVVPGNRGADDGAPKTPVQIKSIQLD
ncbi:peptidylprolyl isomerase [Mycolicibacterium sp. P1-18]|uniref:peptidylprolyl isomerase n=1 Tax=Mycolicibacterium sp. P1-18 TaxID=2024615 RepID=UPI0011F2B664|nr:peptidylprolyl isomerase [Mycolicibacterium sp. P1-18]KAA0101110.1 peptidylprolyl isomerase [Mycolicibacterium sp. P1-18]